MTTDMATNTLKIRKALTVANYETLLQHLLARKTVMFDLVRKQFIESDNHLNLTISLNYDDYIIQLEQLVVEDKLSGLVGYGELQAITLILNMMKSVNVIDELRQTVTQYLQQQRDGLSLLENKIRHYTCQLLRNC